MTTQTQTDKTVTVSAKPVRVTKTALAAAKAKIIKAAKAKQVKAKARAAEKRPVNLIERAKGLSAPLHVYRADSVKGGEAFENRTANYAAALVREFGAGFWLVSSQKGKLSENETALRKSVRAEQSACKALAESRGLRNVYKPWSDALALCKNPEGKKKVAGKTKPVPERINVAIFAAFKLAHENYETFEDDAAYVAVYDALEALCKSRRIDTRAITDKQ